MFDKWGVAMGGSLFCTFSLFIIMIKFIFASGFSHSCRPALSYGCCSSLVVWKLWLLWVSHHQVFLKLLCLANHFCNSFYFCRIIIWHCYKFTSHAYRLQMKWQLLVSQLEIKSSCSVCPFYFKTYSHIFMFISISGHFGSFVIFFFTPHSNL